MTRRFWKVRATEERLLIRGQKQCQWPAAITPGQHIKGDLVNLIDIGALLAIHFDIHEIAVHLCRDSLVFKTLVRHDMAPVTGRVAHGKQYRLVLLASERKDRKSSCLNSR